jgi:hypothetical protein
VRHFGHSFLPFILFLCLYSYPRFLRVYHEFGQTLVGLVVFEIGYSQVQLMSEHPQKYVAPLKRVQSLLCLFLHWLILNLRYTRYPSISSLFLILSLDDVFL